MAVTAGYAVQTSNVPPWAVDSRIGTAAGRYALDSVLMPRTDSGLSYIDYRSGVMASGDGGDKHLAMQVTAGPGAMQIRVAQGNAVINTPNQGAYFCCWDTTTEITLDPSSATTDRVDRVIARVYDDYNTALSGGDTGVRKFTVEVWKGTPVSTGTPKPPTITTGGYIDLAFVTINRNTGTLTQAMIEDRRGPGIVARGGMRGLYGANARHDSTDFAQAGAYPGDQRWVHTNGFQHQVYYGGGNDPTRSGWRGVHNCLVYNVNAGPGERWWLTGDGAAAVICQVTIPYPGTPFMIYPTGRIFTIMSPDTSMDGRITIDWIWGPAVNWNNANTFGAPWDRQITVNVPPIMYGPFTREVNVVLSGYTLDCRGDDWGWSFRGNDWGTNLLSVCVYPSTVQPPNEAPPGTDGSGDDIVSKSPSSPPA
jgi:hypothetical protein